LKTGFRFWAVVAAVSIAAWYILSPLAFGRSGLKVVSIEGNAACGKLRVGDMITGIGGSRIPTVDEFSRAEASAKAGDRMAMIVNDGPGGCTAIADGDLGIEVEAVGNVWMRLGTDIAGGYKFEVDLKSLSSGETLGYIADVIEKRFYAIGVKDAYTTVGDGEIEVYLPKGESANSVMFPGKIECFARQDAELRDGVATIKIGDSEYGLAWDGHELSAGGIPRKMGETFELGGVGVRVENFTNSSLVVDEIIFDNSGVTRLEGAQGHVAYDAGSLSYVFSVPVELSGESSERFADVIAGLDPLYGSTQGLLDGLLVYSVDGTEVSKLSIPSSLAGSPIETMSITGGYSSLADAMYNKRMFDMALEGKIESAMVAMEVGMFDGAAGWAIPAAELFFAGCVLFLFVGTLAVYKKASLSVFAAAVPVIEAVLLVGVVEISQSLTTRGWIVDSATLAGGCAFMAASVLQTFLLTEKAVKSRLSRMYARLPIVVISAGVVLSFTPLNRFGLALAFGGIIGYAIVKPLYEEFACRFRT